MDSGSPQRGDAVRALPSPPPPPPQQQQRAVQQQYDGELQQWHVARLTTPPPAPIAPPDAIMGPGSNTMQMLRQRLHDVQQQSTRIEVGEHMCTAMPEELPRVLSLRQRLDSVKLAKGLL